MWILLFMRRIKYFGARLVYTPNLIYKTVLYICMLLFLISLAIYLTPIKTLRKIKIELSNDIYCYRNYELPTLPDVLDDDPPKGRSIFFHETSCTSNEEQKIIITARQACAVESAALLNPNFRVYLLFTSPAAIKLENNENDNILKQLMMYKNVRLKHLNFGRYINGSPIAELYSSLRIEASFYARSHASDVLRYLTLWRYGGIYLDLDVILIKSLERLKPNYAGRESDEDVAAGVLSFSHKGDGHRWARQSLEDLKKNFDGWNWGNNGPGVITRLLTKLCTDTEVKDMSKEKCKGFTVYPPSAFYPIPWRKWNYYFDEEHVKDVLNSLNDTIAIHVWNKHSVNKKIKIGSNVPYEILAKKFCPRTYAAVETVF